MPELLQNPAFRHYILAAVILAFNPLILAGMAGGARGKYKSPVTPEDTKLAGNAYHEDMASEVQRINRAHRNALENIPIILVAGLLYVLAGASDTMVLALMGACVVFRWLHTVIYLKAVQPWRTVCFGLAALATGVMLVHTAILVCRA